MTEWYYAKGGQQNGPMTFEQLSAIARSGGLDPRNDLVWTATMKDWTPAGQVPELFSAPASPVASPLGAPAADPANPYAAPQSAWVEPTLPTDMAGIELTEIPPGSEPIDAGACVQRGFELTKRQFGTILLIGLVCFAAFVGLSLVQGFIQAALIVAFASHDTATSANSSGLHFWLSIFSQLITQTFALFFGLGLTRIGLNLVSGKAVSVGMLFGEGRKLLRAICAKILFVLMVGIGSLFLIVPGIYLGLRYGQYMVAIVDRDLGIRDAFSYSSSITTNNRWNLFVLGLLGFAITIAGMLACGVGLIFACPVVWLSYIVAYRWMQYGQRATQDHTATSTPVLAGM